MGKASLSLCYSQRAHSSGPRKGQQRRKKIKLKPLTFCIFLLFLLASMVKNRNAACRIYTFWTGTNMSIVTHGLYMATVSKFNRPLWLEFRCYSWEEFYSIPLHLRPTPTPTPRGSKTTFQYLLALLTYTEAGLKSRRSSLHCLLVLIKPWRLGRDRWKIKSLEEVVGVHFWPLGWDSGPRMREISMKR